jgi:hypothetical protein
MLNSYKLTFIGSICLAVISAVLIPSIANAAAPVLKWSNSTPGATIRESSPMPVLLNGASSRTDVILGAHNGNVYAYNSATGSYASNWPQPVGYPINSTASSADMSTNGVFDNRIYIGSGTADSGQCSGGSLTSFNVLGSKLFSFVASDNVAGSGVQCSNPAIHSSAAIGDTNNNNQPDISFGAIGLKAWNLSYDGGVNGGWPYYWDDTQFATPALADVSGDGVTDVIMAGDSSPGAPIDFRGGIVKALKGNGTVLWEYRVNEIVRSSPVVGDIDGDGQPEVVFGTGNYWVGQAGGASDATKVFVLNARTGQLKWSRDLGAQTLASPTLADFDGDGVRDIAIGTWNGNQPGQVWVIKGNNSVVSGYPRGSGGGIVIGQISTGDLNADGAQDLLVPTGGGVFAYNGKNGALLWGLRQGFASYQNTPLVQDIDGNGRVDIVIAGTTPSGAGVVDRFEFQTSSEARMGSNGWNMFHADPRLTGNVVAPALRQNVSIPAGAAGQGYVIATDTGQARTYGSTPNNGSVSGGLAQPIVGVTTTAGKDGYWMVSRDGGIFSFGDAPFYGSAGAIRLNQPIVGMAKTASGNGYWLVASDGGIFSYGDARFYGSTGAITLNKPIVGMTPTASGNGYWLVASDGGIFSYGDARFYGSTGAITLNKPIVGMTPTASGNGYWLVASDGGIFAFGDAPFHGSTGAIKLNSPINSIMRAPGNGYWLVASDGGVFTFNAPFYGAGVSSGSAVGASPQS